MPRPGEVESQSGRKAPPTPGEAAIIPVLLVVLILDPKHREND